MDKYNSMESKIDLIKLQMSLTVSKFIYLIYLYLIIIGLWPGACVCVIAVKVATHGTANLTSMHDQSFCTSML